MHRNCPTNELQSMRLRVYQLGGQCKNTLAPTTATSIVRLPVHNPTTNIFAVTEKSKDILMKTILILVRIINPLLSTTTVVAAAAEAVETTTETTTAAIAAAVAAVAVVEECVGVAKECVAARNMNVANVYQGQVNPPAILVPTKWIDQ